MAQAEAKIAESHVSNDAALLFAEPSAPRPIPRAKRKHRLRIEVGTDVDGRVGGTVAERQGRGHRADCGGEPTRSLRGHYVARLDRDDVAVERL